MTTEQKVFVTMFVLGEPATHKDIALYTALDIDQVKESLANIKKLALQLGINVATHNDMIQLLTISEAQNIITNIKKSELDGDLTPAALQVMTIIAYMPGCTRSDVSYIRGSQSSASIRNLITRGLVQRRGEVCHITHEALSYLGVMDNSDLPEYDRLHIEFTEKLKESLSYE